MSLSRKFLSAFLFLTVACIASHVQADEDQRIYIAGYMGLNVMSEKDFEETSTGIQGQIGYLSGQDFAGAIGFKLTPQLRIEGEFNYLTNKYDTIAAPSFGTFTLGGDQISKLAMLNVYYDFDFDWELQPFVGAGVGYGWHDADIRDVSGSVTTTTASDSGYVWQVSGGIKYPFEDDMNILASYRYVDGKDPQFDGYKIDYGAHEIRIGLSWDLPFDY